MKSMMLFWAVTVSMMVISIGNESLADEVLLASDPQKTHSEKNKNFQESDFEKIISRITSKKGTVADTMSLEDIVRKQRADGSWGDIDYANKERSHWPTMTHLLRAIRLADASREEGREEYRDAVHRAIKWWLTVKPRNPNWWFNVIGAPLSLADLAIRFDSELTPGERKGIAALLASSAPKKRMTGQNAAWTDEVRFLKGVITRDAATVRSALDDILSEVRISDGEGITRDWSFHQHGRQMQFGNYGLSFFCTQVRLVRLLEGTSFAYPAEKLDLIQSLASKGYAWIIWKEMLDVSALGRQLLPNAQKGKARAINNAFKNLVANGWTGSLSPTGFRYFDKSAYAIYRTDKWMASVRASTSSIIGVETWINKDNVKGMCMADGALFTYVTGKEYENIFPLWDDWRMIPGVTAYAKKPVDCKRRMNEADDIKASHSPDGGKFSFTFRREGLVAQKSWSFTDEVIVCKGVGITSNDKRWEVMTSVEESLAAPNAGIVYEKANEFCVRNGNLIYIIYAPREAIRFEIKNRSGNFREFMQARPPFKVSGKVFSLRISHGIAPKNATYHYEIKYDGK